MKHIKTYEIFGFSDEEKTDVSKKKLMEVLSQLRAKGYNFTEAAADVVEDVWVYKGARYIGISPKFADKKINVHTLKGDQNKNISLSGQTSDIVNKIIDFIKTREYVLERKRK